MATRGTWAMALAAVLAAFAAAAPEKPAPRGERLGLVLEAAVSFDPKAPQALVVSAVGRVPTGGWTQATLVPRQADGPPEDGLYEFDLTAVRPGGIVALAASKVSATYRWSDPPKGLKGVRVFGSAKGAKAAKLADGKK